MKPEIFTTDVLVVGSGFGGSVAAMRLSQKGYSVTVLEKGKRWCPGDFPKSNQHLSKYLWAPILRCFGPQSITLLKGVMVLHGSGVGGGSLIYANTLMRPLREVFRDLTWPKEVKDWEAELAPHYETAKKMLGVTPNIAIFEAEDALKKLGESMGISETYHATDVGVFFGDGKGSGDLSPDPYFSGQGPQRMSCTFCGGCMVGCRHDAKNTLDKNYLYFAEKWGAQIVPEAQATRITPLDDGGYQVETVVSTSWFKKRYKTFKCKKLILSAGVLGTVELLLKNKEVYGTLPKISDCLGHHVRTNGESLLGVTSFEAHRDYSRGVAIGAAIHPDANTKIEAVKYPSGSNAMRMLAVPLTPAGGIVTRPLKMLVQGFLQLPLYLKMFRIRDWAKHSIILLVMQSIESQMKLLLNRTIFTGYRLGLSGVAVESTIPSYLPVAQEACETLAQQMGGLPQNIVSEVLLQIPATAHILGGCKMGASVDNAVVDFKHEVFNYPGLYVSDGSVIPSNLGVNPSLTITALSERFASLFDPAPEVPESLIRSRQIVFGVGQN